MMKKNVFLLFLLVWVIDARAKDDDVISSNNFSVENRVYSSYDSAFESMMKLNFNGFYYGVGGYFSFDRIEDEISPSLDLNISKGFNISNDISMDFSLGFLNLKPYVDYNVGFDVNKSIALVSGYRFHFNNDVINRNELYLGFKYKFGHYGVDSTKHIEVTSPKELVKPNYVHIPILSDFSYDFGEAISHGDLSELKVISEWIFNNPHYDVVITGHTDSSGSEKYNYILSKKRAEKIALILMDKYSVDKHRIIVRGMGELSPLYSNSTRYGRKHNRRVDITFHKS